MIEFWPLFLLVLWFFSEQNPQKLPHVTSRYLHPQILLLICMGTQDTLVGPWPRSHGWCGNDALADNFSAQSPPVGCCCALSEAQIIPLPSFPNPFVLTGFNSI